MNKILERVKTDVNKVADSYGPDVREKVDRTVIAGEKIMFDEKTHANMDLIKNPDAKNNLPETVAAGVTGLIALLYKQSKQSMGVDIAILSGTLLMVSALDFAEEGLGVQVTNEVISETTKLLTEKLFEKLGIKPEQLNETIVKGKAAYEGGGMAGQEPGQPVQEPQQPPPGQEPII